MNNVDYNELITIEEADNLLRFVKRVYPGRFDGVEIYYGDDFAYYPEYLVITIPEYFEDFKKEIGMNILKHVNEEFNAEFEYNLRVMSIQAVLHECGHHIDFDSKFYLNTIDEYIEKDKVARDEHDNLTEKFNKKVKKFVEKLDEYELSGEEDEETEFLLEENRLELKDEESVIDKLYRMIPSEYTADEFSARFFMTYMRGYKKADYNVF